MKNLIKIVAFDADDTLWDNELYFQEFEREFCSIMKDIAPSEVVSNELFSTEMKNLHLYGYGAKGMTLCMIEVIGRLAKNDLACSNLIAKVISLSHELLQMPIELLDGVEETLFNLKGKYRLILATKGDLTDQERKIEKSGLKDIFDSVHIMSDKKILDYKELLKKESCVPNNFLMVGNSLKSDIIPVLDINGNAVHVPYRVTWKHEQSEQIIEHPNFFKIAKISDILNYI
ncbi:HAD family hydrolase [Dysgonomonas massiliensis]|uniref:HAD family hydrolase n=1 Tax=Dysgonomonas massiliensis TaxID=2040292 RepID=UPI000C760768|nr:HAD family hydrolase [Dysgonomonas massiliensis]